MNVLFLSLEILHDFPTKMWYKIHIERRKERAQKNGANANSKCEMMCQRKRQAYTEKCERTVMTIKFYCFYYSDVKIILNQDTFHFISFHLAMTLVCCYENEFACREMRILTDGEKKFKSHWFGQSEKGKKMETLSSGQLKTQISCSKRDQNGMPKKTLLPNCDC